MKLMKIALATVLAGCLLYLGVYGASTLREENVNREMADSISALRQTSALTPSPSPTQTLRPTETASMPAIQLTPSPTAFLETSPPLLPSADPLLARYAQLKEQNPDMIGWIYIEDTPVDYPVMYHPEEKDYYLHRGFDGNYAFEGVPFLDERCDPLRPSDNLIIYGHHMKNGKLFGSLKYYLRPEYYQQHPIICFDTLDSRAQYRVFAVIPVILGEMEDERMRCYGVRMTEDRQQIEKLKAYVERYASISSPEALPEVGGQVLTLSTCTGIGDANRLVVMATRME